VLLIVLALGIAWGTLSGLGQSNPAPEGFTLVIAAGGAVIQEALSRYTRRVAHRSGSAALRATAWDYRLDALGSLVVLFGVGAARLGGPSWHWADHVAGALVAGTILWVGVGLLWENVQGLMDRQADPDFVASIRAEALTVPGVRDVETLRVRKAGLEYLVDIHIEVDPDLTVREGHRIAHLVKDRLIHGAGPVRDVLVHVEPSSNREIQGPA
jgi:cation diffusion facilitator family transporter